MLQLIIEGWGYITLEQIPHYTDIATLHPNPILSYSQFITGNFYLAGLASDSITPDIKISLQVRLYTNFKECYINIMPPPKKSLSLQYQNEGGTATSMLPRMVHERLLNSFYFL